MLTHEPFTVGSIGGGGRWRVVAGATDGNIATYAVAVSLNNVDTSVRDMRNWAVLIGATVMLACAVTAWFGVRRAFRPLTQIEDTAAAIAAGDLTRRIPARTAQDEVSSLSTSLNVMLAQIEQSFAVREASEERMRQFVADASHELRTPLAAVRGYAELFRQGAVSKPEDVATAMRRIEEEATRMGGLVQDLLLLTRLDDQRPVRLGPVDLTVLVADAAQDARALDPSRTVTVVGLDGELAPTTVQGDDARLRQVLTNLVGNAINHTPAGTPIEIAVGRRAPGRAEVQVRDHGPRRRPGEGPPGVRAVLPGRPLPRARQGRRQRPGPGHRRRDRGGPPRQGRRRADPGWRRDVRRRPAHRKLPATVQRRLTRVGLSGPTNLEGATPDVADPHA